MNNARRVIGLIMAGAVISAGGATGYAYMSNNSTKTSTANVKLLVAKNKTSNTNENSIATNGTSNKVTIGNNKINAAIKNGQINLDSTLAKELFLGSSSYTGTQNSTNTIKIVCNNKTNTIEEYSTKNSTKVYQLKLVPSVTQMGIQLNKYENNKLLGQYNLLYGNGQWAGTYTTVGNAVSNVVIQG